MKRYVRKRRRKPRERARAIVLPKKPRIREPGADHALIARDNRLPAILGLQIGDKNEAIGQFPCLFMTEGETFLMRLHGGHQDFLRHIEKALIEFAGENHGPLDEPRILQQQPVVFNKSEPGLRSGFMRAIKDNLCSLISCDHTPNVQKCF